MARLAASALLAVSVVLCAALCTTSARELCRDQSAPIRPLVVPRTCAAYANKTCCSRDDELAISVALNALGADITSPSNAECMAKMRGIACATCDPSSFDMFRFNGEIDDDVQLDEIAVPLLCNSFCGEVYDACAHVRFTRMPFMSGANTASALNTTLAEAFSSRDAFCGHFANATAVESRPTNATHPMHGRHCYSGMPFKATQANESQSVNVSNSVCLARVLSDTAMPERTPLGYINMAWIPNDTTRRVFLSTMGGIVRRFVYALQNGSFVDDGAFLNVTSRVWELGERGLLGFAFHPDFATNGRAFVSYTCKPHNAFCSWPCERGCEFGACGADGYCTGIDNIGVVAEYKLNPDGSSASSYVDPITNATVVVPFNETAEVRRVFMTPNPFDTQHGGQLLFGADGMLYLMLGDGGSNNDPLDLAQTRASPMGKILRIDVDESVNATPPTAKQCQNHPLWYMATSPVTTYADGLRNPWRCSFDRTRPDYFFCGDVGEKAYEEVNLIVKDGNYGWRDFEGHNITSNGYVRVRDELAALFGAHEVLVDNSAFVAPYTAALSDALTPLLELALSTRGRSGQSSGPLVFPVSGFKYKPMSSITGGYVVRGETAGCMRGRYLFADLFARFYAADELPRDSGVFATMALSGWRCNSTLSGYGCPPGGSVGLLASFGEDAAGDVYALTSTGVYRVLDPGACGIPCNITVTASGAPVAAPSATPNVVPSQGVQWWNDAAVAGRNEIAIIAIAVCVIVLSMYW